MHDSLVPGTTQVAMTCKIGLLFTGTSAISAMSPIHIMRFPPRTPTPTQCFEPFVTFAWSFTTISNSSMILLSGWSTLPTVLSTVPKSIVPRSWSFRSPTVELSWAVFWLRAALFFMFLPTLTTFSETRDIIEVSFTGRITCNGKIKTWIFVYKF